MLAHIVSNVSTSGTARWYLDRTLVASRNVTLVSGDTIEEYLPLSGAGMDVRLRAPDGREETTQTEARDEIGVLRWADTDQSGLYRATIGQHPQEYLFAVNVPVATDTQLASESDLARTNSTELQAAYPGWTFRW